MIYQVTKSKSTGISIYRDTKSINSDRKILLLALLLFRSLDSVHIKIKVLYIMYSTGTDDEDGNSGANIPVAAIATVMSLVGVACASVCVFILIKTKRLHDNNQEKMRNLSHE